MCKEGNYSYKYLVMFSVIGRCSTGCDCAAVFCPQDFCPLGDSILNMLLVRSRLLFFMHRIIGAGIVP